MSDAPRVRLVFLTLVVALAFVQPAPGGASTATAAAAPTGGDVGTTVGAAIERHPSSAGATADSLRSVRADAVHERGLTGAGVDVGVIGRGFDTRGSVVAPHVIDRTRIGGPAGATGHDTAVAAIVSETAPSADLYLAGIGRTPTPSEYASAVRWLTDRGVDVIVDSGSYFPSVAGDGERITAAAERATDRGVVFVTSAGNYADRHWAGTGSDDGWVTFATGDAANALGGGERIRGRVTVRLRWQSAADYDLYLYRRLPDAPDRVVAKSTSDDGGQDRAVEGIDVAVPTGRYYVAVYTADGSDTTPGRVQVFSARHELEHATAHGSMVAPATSDRVVAVGAATDGELADYSSLSANGSVDLIAPGGAGGRATEDLAGTSAAAPYVAGTAALMQSGGNDPAPARVEAILERTADGEDDALDAVEAVEAVEAATTSTDGASDSVGDADASGDDATGESAADWDRNATRTGEDDGVRPAEREGDGRSDSDDDAGTDRNDEGDGTRTDEQDDDGDRDRSDGQRDRAGDGDSATAGSEERESDERRGS